MKNMKMKAKLLTSFCSVVILTIVLGIVAIVSLVSVDSQYNKIVDVDMPGIYYLGKAESSLRTERSEMRAMVIYLGQQNQEGYAGRLSALQASRNETREEMRAFRALIDGDSVGIENYETLQALYEKYSTDVDSFIEICNTGDADAATEYLSAFAAEADDTLNHLDTMSDSRMTDAGRDSNTASANVAASRTLIIIVLVVVVVLAVAVALYIASIITKPLEQVLKVAKKVGESGDLEFSDEEVAQFKSFATARDELGQTLAAFAAMMDGLVGKSKQLVQVASGDLTVDVELVSGSDTLGVAIKSMVDNLNDMFGEINLATQQVSTGSSQVADAAQSLAQGASEQAATVEELSAAIGDVDQKTKDNAHQANRAAELGETIKGNAEKGSEQMSNMMAAVNEISDSSQNIGKVIKVIDDIAFQTNILALNAAVEAARAGAHGKGFAVVADEVRNLAAKSAEAARDTGSLIENSITKSELGAKIAAETAQSLNEIVQGIHESSQIVSSISESSNEQAGAISQINTAIEQVAQVVQQNSATAEESAASSEEMSSQADVLSGLVARFKLRGQKPAEAPQYAMEAAQSRPAGAYMDGMALSYGQDKY